MSFVCHLILIIVLTSTNAEILKCQEDEALFPHILATIFIRNYSYIVAVDTGSPDLWLITKHYTFWQYDHPGKIVDQMDCILESPDLVKIPSNFTVNRPTYVPDPTTEITVHDVVSCPLHRIGFGGDWLIVIMDVYKEKVTIGQSDFNLHVGGGRKLIVRDFEVSNYYGIMGLLPTFSYKVNKPNFLFNVRQYLQRPMFALYLGNDDDDCKFSLGEPIRGIPADRLTVVQALNNENPMLNWIIKQRITAEMRYCNGNRTTLPTSFSGTEIHIDSGNPKIYLPSKMVNEFYRSLEINPSHRIPDLCDFWKTVNPILYLKTNGGILFELTFDNIIQRFKKHPDTCICRLHISNGQNKILLGASLFKTYYVEFDFEEKWNREIRFALISDLKN